METLGRWLRRAINLTTASGRASSSNAVQTQQSSAESPVASLPGPSGTLWTPPPGGVVDSPPPVYKVVTVGGGGVGKSSLIVRFMYDEVRLQKSFVLCLYMYVNMGKYTTKLDWPNFLHKDTTGTV